MRSINKRNEDFLGNNTLGAGRVRIPTYSHLWGQVKRLVFSSHPGFAQMKPRREGSLCYYLTQPKGNKYPGTADAAVFCSELGWTPRLTVHSACPTSFPQYLWVTSCLFMVFLERLQHQRVRPAICEQL